MNPCIIDTPRLCLRTWIDSDNIPFIAMNGDPEVMAYLPATLTATETLAMINRINVSFDSNGFGLYAIENKKTKEFLGFTGFSIPRFKSYFTPCIEIGWRFQKKSWGQGYATEAARACLSFGFEKLGFSKIVSFTAAVNRKSEQVMKRIGMNYVAEFNHPSIDKENMLCRHVLYELTA